VAHRHPRVLSIKSEVLRSNALGDGVERDVWVYTPPGYDEKKPLPALIALAGFTGNGAMLFNADALGDTLGARLDRLIGAGVCPPCIVAAPDCFTRLGGNQYIDSTATGAYATHVVNEVVPEVSSSFAVSSWGVFGKSSGGYGAVVLAMLYPDVFRAFADHSGDANFELCYLPDALEALDQIRAAGGPRAWLDAYWKAEQRRLPKQIKTLNFLAMAAHYSPNPDAELGFDLPFDTTTGAFRQDVWARWQAWDPVRMVDRHVDALRRMRAIFIDSGTKDECGLHWGARALSAELTKHGIAHTHEEFEDGHMNIPYRFERSIPILAQALSRAEA
jgi:S-formylglutathione hydrolase FrmB